MARLYTHRMKEDWAAERARAKAEQLLQSLDLSDAERQAAHAFYVRMLGAVTRNRDFWRKVQDGSMRAEVIPSAAAMLTAYTDESVRAMREGHSPPSNRR